MGMGEQKLRFKNSQQTTDEGNESEVPVEIAQAYECRVSLFHRKNGT